MPGFDPKKEEEKRITRIFTLISRGFFSNYFSINKEECNNIIYYNDNKSNLNSIYEESDYFERNTPGAFILCINIESLNIIKEEIMNQIKRDKKIIFNLILGAVNFEIVNKFLEENIQFYNSIQNICIYSSSSINNQNLKFKNIYSKINNNIYDNKENIVNFIKKYSSKDIKPFPLIKIITYKDYIDNIDNWKDTHFKISEFYGDLPKKNQEHISNEKKTDDKSDGSKENINKLLSNFMTFDINNDLELIDKIEIGNANFIISNNFFPKKKDIIYYLFGRFIYNLHYFTKKKKNLLYLNENNKQIFRGAKLSFTNLLLYERAKGKIIMNPNFLSASDEKIAKRFARRNSPSDLYESNLKFSVIFTILNNYKKDYISNIIELPNNKSNIKEYVIFPFSFFYVKDIKIDLKNYIADIYLVTIGKIEILEEQIKKGKEIYYNEKENLIKIKDDLMLMKEIKELKKKNKELINQIEYSSNIHKKEEINDNINKIIISENKESNNLNIINDNEIKKISIENSKLKKENEQLSQLVEQLKQKLNNKDNEVNNLIKENHKLNSEKINIIDNKNKIIYNNSKTQEKPINDLNLIELYKDLRERDNEIRQLNKKLNEIKSRYPFDLLEGEELMSIIFISSDENIHFSIICKNTDPFTKIEGILYKRYPEYRNSHNYFIVNNYRVSKYNTLKENNIKNNDIITLVKIDNE